MVVGYDKKEIYLGELSLFLVRALHLALEKQGEPLIEFSLETVKAPQKVRVSHDQEKQKH